MVYKCLCTTMLCIYICIYIYTYISRERERENRAGNGAYLIWLTHSLREMNGVLRAVLTQAHVKFSDVLTQSLRNLTRQMLWTHMLRQCLCTIFILHYVYHGNCISWVAGWGRGLQGARAYTKLMFSLRRAYARMPGEGGLAISCIFLQLSLSLSLYVCIYIHTCVCSQILLSFRVWPSLSQCFPMVFHYILIAYE